MPSFLDTSNTGIAQGRRLYITYPLFNNSWTCLWNSFISSGLVPYAGRFGKDAQGNRLIWCFIPLIGGNLAGISSGNISLYCCKIEKTIRGNVEVKLLVFNITSLYISTRTFCWEYKACLTSLFLTNLNTSLSFFFSLLPLDFSLVSLSFPFTFFFLSQLNFYATFSHFSSLLFHSFFCSCFLFFCLLILFFRLALVT